MKRRLQRQNAIRDIIRAHNVKTQQDLVELLQIEGYECTQATVSRDIMEMGLAKSQEGHYMLSEEVRLQHIVSEQVEEVCAAGNIVVIKTLPGAAAAVSAVIDEANLFGALGSVAGDDTIMLVAKSDKAAAHLQIILDHLRQS